MHPDTAYTAPRRTSMVHQGFFTEVLLDAGAKLFCNGMMTVFSELKRRKLEVIQVNVEVGFKLLWSIVLIWFDR